MTGTTRDASLSRLRKRPLEGEAAMNSRAVDEIDIAGCAAIAYSSENPAHPVEHLLDGRSDAAKLAAVDSGLATGNAAAPPPSPPADWTVLNVDTLRDDDWGRTVRYGRDLITKTYALIGPEVADASHRYYKFESGFLQRRVLCEPDSSRVGGSIKIIT
jgi:hypothetical protein